MGPNLQDITLFFEYFCNNLLKKIAKFKKN